MRNKNMVSWFEIYIRRIDRVLDQAFAIFKKIDVNKSISS